MFADMNWLAIVVCTVFSMVLGFIWYGPLFDKPWMKLVGLKKEDIDPKDSMKGHLISLFGSFIGSVALAVIVKWMGYGLVNGLLGGAFFSFAFIVTSYFSGDAYEKRPFSLSLINAGYRFVYFAVIGAILGIWH
jgi:MFS family permease